MRVTSIENLYQELDLERLKTRGWFRKPYFYKIFNEKSHSYLFNSIPNLNKVYNIGLGYNIPPRKVRHDYFKNSFFLSAISEWNNIRNLASLNTFKEKFLNFIRNCPNSIFDIYNLLEIKFLTLRQALVTFMNINYGTAFKILYILYKNDIEYSKDIESTIPFFLHSSNLLIPRQALLQIIKNIDIFSPSETQLIQTILYKNQNYNSRITRALTGLLIQPSNT